MFRLFLAALLALLLAGCAADPPESRPPAVPEVSAIPAPPPEASAAPEAPATPENSGSKTEAGAEIPFRVISGESSVSAAPTAASFPAGGGQITFLLKNQSESPLRYGGEYQLWREEPDGGLTSLPNLKSPPPDPLAPPENGSTSPSFLLPAGESETVTVSLAPFGPLETGNYRVTQLCTLLSADGADPNLETCMDGACTEINLSFTLV